MARAVFHEKRGELRRRYREGHRTSYRLFALSNTACILALLACFLAVEPTLTVPVQLRYRSVGYLVVVLLVATGAISNS